MWRQLANLMAEAGNLPLPADWYAQSHCKVLAEAKALASTYGVTHKTITSALLSSAPASGDNVKHVRANYQREAYQQLLDKGSDRLNMEERHRKKQARWKLAVPPRHGATRALGLFKRLSTLVRPRVVASLLRTHWNGWCTRRRFQHEGPCVFACSESAADSIEHYMYCPIFHELLRDFLHLPKFSDLQEFLLLNHRLWSDNRLSVSAVAVHALYTTFNHVRIHGPRSRPYLCDYMQRTCYHATSDHNKSQGALRVAMSNTRNWWH